MSRYPLATLQESVGHLERLYREVHTTEIDPNSAASALGHASLNGAARAKLAALKGYGLIERSKAKLKVSNLGLEIAEPLGSSREAGLRKAALLPDLFTTIAKDYPHLQEGVLASTLVHKHGMDRDSAKDASKIFKANYEFANLRKTADDPDEFGEESTPPAALANAQIQGPPQQSSREAPQSPPTRSTGLPVIPAIASAPDSFLQVPLDIGPAYIPKGMSEDDFEVLLESLTLWKRKIVKAEWPKMGIWRNADHDQPVTINGPMGEKDGVKYFRSSTGTGIPEHELEFR